MPARLLLRPLALLLLALLVAPSTQAQSAESIVVREAIAEYQRTGRARVLEVGQTILVPYGQVDPVLKTALLRTSLIELGRNEWVVDRFMGDSLRWDVDFGVVGTEQSFRQIVSIKPTDQDLTTSLVLTTNTGRIYHFTLDSEPYPGIERTQNPTDIPYTAHVKFYYPEEASPDGLYTVTGGTTDAMGALDPNYVDLASLPLNTASYVIEADEGFPCPPISAGDNGTQLRIEFPDHTADLSCSQRFPLYSVNGAGELELLNYSMFGGNTYVADRVPSEARILYRTEFGGVQQVVIRNTAIDRPRGPLGVTVGAGLGTSVPSSTAPFRQSVAPGFDIGLSGVVQTSRSFSVGAEIGYTSFSTNTAFVGDAVEFALNESLAPAIASRLAASGAIDKGESVALYTRGAEAAARTLRLSAVGRLSLAPEARVEPYLGGRLGVVRRSSSAVTFQTTGLVIGADGTRRQSAALEGQIENSFAGTGDRRSAEALDFERLLQGEYGSEYELPAWLVGESDPQTGLEVGASFGIGFRATSMLRVYAEGEYALSPFSDRADRALIPFRLGVRASL
ncbi:MAG: TrbG/VirB9 family P-type conjugative transfer protein [Myxococcota bacterium]